MFRKPKRTAKASLRSKKRKDDDVDEGETSQLLEEARRANKKTKTTTTADESTTASTSIMHEFQVSSEKQVTAADLATRTAEYHPENVSGKDTAERGEDGVFRDKTRNKFLAGPIKASTFVRTTCRFDYQPDICKDYKDTGFCGFGDTCIYLHDRGDTLTGWQLEQQWEEQRKKELEQKKLDAFAADGKTEQDAVDTRTDDGLPFACHVCREAFTQPVVTSCGHYFCEQCIMDHVRQNEKGTCPICGKDTHGVFNQPTKLISKKRRLLGSKATWQEYADASRKNTEDGNEKER